MKNKKLRNLQYGVQHSRRTPIPKSHVLLLHLGDVQKLILFNTYINILLFFYWYTQGGMPWKKCLAEMWLKDRPGSSTPDNNTRVVRITKHNEPLVSPLLIKMYNLKLTFYNKVA